MKRLQILAAVVFLAGLIFGIQAESVLATAIFQILLALTFIFALVVWPLVNLQQQEIPEEDFQRDVREGL